MPSSRRTIATSSRRPRRTLPRLAGGIAGLAGRRARQLVGATRSTGPGAGFRRATALSVICRTRSSAARRNRAAQAQMSIGDAALAIVATSHEDLREKLRLARTAIAEGSSEPRRSPRRFLRGQAGVGRCSRWHLSSPARAHNRRACSGSWRSFSRRYAQAFEEFDRVLLAQRRPRLGR